MGNIVTEFVSLRNDLLFHMVFTRNAEALKGLISVLLNIPEHEILKVEVLNPMQYSEVIDSKLTVLDLKVHLNDGTYVLVEMQVRKFEYWTNRTIAYACRQIADQVHGDFDYGKLESVIQISIMDYTLFPDHPRFFKRYGPRDDEGYPFSDKLQFYVMDLTQTDTANEDQKKQGLVEWANAFRADSWTEVNEIENSGVKEAAKTMQLIMSNPAERDLIRMRMDAEIDRRTQTASDKKEGSIETLISLVGKGLLKMEDAAAEANMSLKDFAQMVKK